MEPGTKRLLMIAGGLAGLLVVVLAASSLVGRHKGEVPVVQADTRPIRVKPENPGGLQVVGAGHEIFSGPAEGNVTRLVPAAETPDPKALHAAPMSPPAAPASSPVGVTTSSGPAPLSVLVPQAVGAPGAATIPAVPPHAAKPEAAHAPPAQPSTQPMPRPVPQAAKPVSSAQATTLAAAPSAATPATVQADKRTSPGGTASVQLAALETEAAARAEWQNLVKRMPDLLSGRQSVFTKVERDGRVIWRVRAAGFSDVNEAKSFCERARAKGTGCTVANF